MTDLLSRPTRAASAKKARGRGDSGDPQPRSLATNGLLGGLVASLVTLVLCMAVAITGWFLADAGAHGDTTDALRVGADAWLVGHGSGLTLSGAPLGIVPLGLTAVLVLAAFRAGRWAGRVSAPPEGPTALAPAVAAYAVVYALVAVVTWVLAATPAADPGLGRAALGGLVVAALGGGTGLAVGADVLGPLVLRVPAWVRTTAYGAVVGALGVVVLAALAVAVSLALSINEAATVVSGLHLGVGDALSYAVVIALLAPNCVLLAASYLLGPGFALGTGTVVAPTGVTVGALPAFPVLAAVPAEGPAPGWLLGLTALPALAAAVAAGKAQRRSADRAYDLGALRGAAVGVGAAILLSIAIALAGGPMGTGRMVDIGAPFFEVLVLASGGLGVGGMLGGVLTTWWQRRRERA